MALGQEIYDEPELRGGQMKILVALSLVLVPLYFHAGSGGDELASRLKQASSTVFELHIGERVFEIGLDQPARVVTPGGETIEVVLRRKAVLHYSGAGVRFDYPSQLEVGTETEDGVTTITLEGTSSPFVLVQVYPASSTTPAAVLNSLLEAFAAEYASKQARALPGSGQPVSRTIGGTRLEGRGLRHDFLGQEIVTEIYSLAKDGAVVAMVFQHDAAERELAEGYFQVIARNFR
ncbi:hypothetical protein HRbin33_01418 [bacterium HR33]|nr:hypothetical protein HRbin33_01418 [bacterium HR33]